MSKHKLSNGQEVWFRTFTGEVLSEKKTVNTSIHQLAPTYTANVDKDGVAGLSVIPGEVYSELQTEHDVWLRDANGKEKMFNLGNIGLPVRSGHIVTVVWGSTEGNKTGHHIGARNHTTNEVLCNVERTVGDGLKDWKLDVGVDAYLWKSIAKGAALGAFAGFFVGFAKQSDTLGWTVFLSICGAILAAVFSLKIGYQLFLGPKFKKLLNEIDSLSKSKLLADVSDGYK